MLVQSYCPPIPTSTTAKSTCVHRGQFQAFCGCVCVFVSWGGMYGMLWLSGTLCVYAVYLLLQEDMEGQKSQKLEIERHGASTDTLDSWMSDYYVLKKLHMSLTDISSLNE